MKLYRDEAVVLRTHQLGEADRIITLLTRHGGIVRAVAKGVRRTSSRFGARVEPFSVVDLQLYRGKNLDTVTQAQTIMALAGPIGADYAKYTVAAVLTETAGQLTGEDPASTEQYLLLVGALAALARGQYAPELILNSYLLRALALAGWAPAALGCAQCGTVGKHTAFSVLGGGAQCQRCADGGAREVSGESLALLADLLAGNWEAVTAYAPAPFEEVSELVANYAQWHLGSRLRSLPLVQV